MLAVADQADLDNGPRTPKSATERMCAVSRQVRPIDELIRFVVAPTGEVIADLKRKLPGRGLWVSASHKTVTEAVRRNVFARGFKTNIKAAPTLAQDTDAMLARGVLDALAMAAKASQVVSGFTRVEAALQGRQAVALIHASDGAADGIRKLDAVARQNDGIATGSRDILIVTALTSDELDLALGRSNVIHAAVLAGSAGKTFLSRCQILVRYRLADDGDANAATAKMRMNTPKDAAETPC
ncbi:MULTISPECIES: RNA-binding protein [Rhodopseudomonas]|uniref:RNA-binding protein n=1 Tax=Rhodopseudomonas TaxID=1073 RepID=UPI0005CA40EA|nr:MULTISPECIES: RNA-binding protein [Rhodopseudomonas]MDF3814217.1 RNA-binding protein [Rhodopseudomonas sp. BAL398]WOK16804.1 RNA-binding protein [Rhodopseudomonas sp. BAL398]